MSIEESNFSIISNYTPTGAAPYMVMPGARIGVKNGKLVESLGSLGQSHLAGITGPPTYGIGTGIGTQAMAGCSCYPSGVGTSEAKRALIGMPLIIGAALLGLWWAWPKKARR
jgi:hypothetical protein